MTPEDIVSIAPDGSLQRHALFARYILGETWRNAMWIGRDNEGHPLGSDDMRYIAHHWSLAGPEEGTG